MKKRLAAMLLALMLLVLPLPWVLAAALAAFVHECFHYGAVNLLGGRVYSLRLGWRGAAMETTPLMPGRELVAAFAGPLGSALMILLWQWLPRTAVCSAVHCAFNLLPLFPLDGGRMLRSVMVLLFRNGEGKFRMLQKILRGILAVLVIAGCLRWGIWVAALGIFLLIGEKGRELFDKRPFCGYNKTDIEQ